MWKYDGIGGAKQNKRRQNIGQDDDDDDDGERKKYKYREIKETG